jgi:transketolase
MVSSIAVGTAPGAGMEVPALLAEQAQSARALIIDMAASPVGCHLGGSLSVIDLLLAALARADRDPGSQVILSKGHAAAALYAALHVRGVIHENPAPRYGRPGQPYTGHPGPKVKGVTFPTGSLGHGVPYALGWALGQKLHGSPALGIAIVGDGELQEGLTWESFQIAQAKEVGNFIVMVDCNGCQNDGYVAEISRLPRLEERFSSFGFDVANVDGHDFAGLWTCLERTRAHDRLPLAVLAHTIKGKGISEIEGRAACHYMTISPSRAKRWKQGLS